MRGGPEATYQMVCFFYRFAEDELMNSSIG